MHSWVRPGDRHWSNVEMLPNGDLLVPSKGEGGGEPGALRRSLARLDWQGREVWRRFIEAHHDVEVTPSGEIAVLTYRMRRIRDVDPDTDVRDVSIVTLDGNGRCQLVRFT